MERDPVVFAWRSAPGHHAAAIGLAIGLGGPLALLALLCLRDLVAILTGGSDQGMFLRVALPLPGQVGEAGPLLLSAGWTLPLPELILAALVGLSVAALGSAALGWGVARVAFQAQARTLRRLNGRVTEAILRAPPGARDDARSLTQGIGAMLGRVDTLFGLCLLVPALAAGAILLALFLAVLAAPRLVPAV
ncbi:MAG TPA: ABC transporter ATP-binding protein, partial [Methylobacterium sp.]